MVDSMPFSTLYLSRGLWIGAIVGAGVIAFFVGRTIPALVELLSKGLTNPQTAKDLRRLFEPYTTWMAFVTGLSLAEITLLLVPKGKWLSSGEWVLSLVLTLAAAWLGSRLLRQFFDRYLLDVAFRQGRKVNSELLVVGKVLGNTLIVLIGTILFAETHQLNIFGVFASLGIGGLAVAFAAQKVLEQLLGGIVIYVDRPFTVDDYIGLPDGTFGRVESIGLRSTKIRTSGKGTLMVVPNSSLTQVNIENFTGAKKVMSIVYLRFYRQVTGEEQALIRQVILDSTKDIFGIDPRSTDVAFQEIGDPAEQGKRRTQAQCTFFILGSGEVTMGLRRQLLDIASQKISRTLRDYGIAFEIEDPTIYVDSPITI